MQLSESQIQNLLSERSITEEWPWSTNDSKVIEKHIKDIIAEIRRKTGVEDKTVFNHYGSGFASYVDCWLCCRSPKFLSGSIGYQGLVVLFSRFSHYYVMGEGNQSGDEKGGSSYLPSFEFVDFIKHPRVQELETLVSPILDTRGLCRLRSTDLSTTLPSNWEVPTILADGAYRHYDALFYWSD